MSVGNTIGRMVGQPPASSKPPEMANPIAQLFQGLQQLIPMWQQLSGLIQQLMGGGGGGGGGGGAAPGGAPSGGASPGGSAPGGGAAANGGAQDSANTSDPTRPGSSSPQPTAARLALGLDADGGVESLGALRDRLTRLGRAIRPAPGAMEGTPRPDQAATQGISREILQAALQTSGTPGRPVHQLALDALQRTATALAQGAPSTPQAAQALDTAATMAGMRNANGPVLQMLQQVLGIFQQALSLMQKIKPATGGGKVRER